MSTTTKGKPSPSKQNLKTTIIVFYNSGILLDSAFAGIESVRVLRRKRDYANILEPYTVYPGYDAMGNQCWHRERNDTWSIWKELELVSRGEYTVMEVEMEQERDALQIVELVKYIRDIRKEREVENTQTTVS